MRNIQPPPDLLPLSSDALQKVKNQNLFPQHSDNSLSTIALIFFFSLLHFLSHPVLHLPHPPARSLAFLSRRQGLFSAEHSHGFTGLLTLNSRILRVRTVKSGSSCFSLSFRAYVFPSHNFNMLFLTFFTSYGIFLFLLPLTAFNFSFSFFPFPNSLSQFPPRKINIR